MAKYTYDLIVIGGGAAGLTCSTGAGQLGAKTLLVEKENKLGGDCLHYGCVPSKTLIKSAYAYNILKNSPKYGLPSINVPEVDFNKIAQRIQKVIATILKHDSPEFIRDKYNVETQFGEPKFLDNHSIDLDGKTITAKNFVLATGSSAAVVPIEGLDHIPYITNVEIFSLAQLPKSLIVLGGGPIGLEMAQAFARLGSKVTVVEFLPQLLAKEDVDIGEFVKAKLESEGIEIMVSAKATRAEKAGDLIKLSVDQQGQVKNISAEKLLVATGRKPNVKGLNLEKAGIEYSRKGIAVNKHLQTSTKNIYACGDVNGGLQFTHVAGYEGGIAMVNAIMHLPASVDYTRIPWCTYLDPEIASVGYNEQRASQAGIDFSVQKELFSGNDRALAEAETEGFIKLVINKKGVPIGAQIVGFHAGELIHEWITALSGKVGLSTIAQAVHAYPTLSEISKGVSGKFLAPKLFNNFVKKALKVLFRLQGN